MARARNALTYTNVTAMLALAITLGGGIAIAGKKGTAAKPAVVRQASLKLEASQVNRKMLALPGLGKLLGGCSVNGDSGAVEFQNTSGRHIAVTGIDGIRSETSGFYAAPSYETLAPGESAYYGEPGGSSTHLLFAYPKNPEKARPQASLRLNVRGCGMTAFVIGEKR